MLNDGRYQELLLTNRQYAFARISGEEGIIVGVNNDDKEAQMNIRIPMQGKEYMDLISGETFETGDGCLHVTLGANESLLVSMK